jgi:deoxynucleotidyltransferase terminal-interacting protein 1
MTPYPFSVCLIMAFSKSLLTATGGKAYMLLVDDVRALAQSLEYKHSPDVLLEEVAGFSVPDSILRKMRAAMHQSPTGGCHG